MNLYTFVFTAVLVIPLISLLILVLLQLRAVNRVIDRTEQHIKLLRINLDNMNKTTNKLINYLGIIE